jgi:hypothetical protein
VRLPNPLSRAPVNLARCQLANTDSCPPPCAGLVEYITSGPVVAIALEGKDVVAQARKLIGATNPLASAPGTIRCVVDLPGPSAAFLPAPKAASN